MDFPVASVVLLAASEHCSVLRINIESGCYLPDVLSSACDVISWYHGDSAFGFGIRERHSLALSPVAFPRYTVLGGYLVCVSGARIEC